MMHAGRPASAVKRVVVALSFAVPLVACGGQNDSLHLPRGSTSATDEASLGDTTVPGGLVDVSTIPGPLGTLAVPPTKTQDGTAPSVTVPGVTTPPPVVENGRPPMLFNRVVVQDPMANNVDAIIALVPDGWQTQASVQWLPELKRTAFLQTHITDPVTGITIDWLPIQDFIYFPPPSGFDVPIGGNYQGKIYVAPITDPVELVSQMWATSTLPWLQSATLVDVQPVQAVADEFKRQFGGPADALAYRMRYEFQQNGQTWEQDLSFAMLYTGTPELTSWYVNFASTVQAPKGVLDQNAGLISTIIASRTTSPQWEATYRLVQNLFNQGIRQQMADTVAFGRALAAYNAEIFALQQQVTAERAASQDRIAEYNGQILEGVQPYDDPFDGSVVVLPSGWIDYWVNAEGGIITSDQPNFDPNSLGLGVFEKLVPQT